MSTVILNMGFRISKYRENGASIGHALVIVIVE